MIKMEKRNKALKYCQIDGLVALAIAFGFTSDEDTLGGSLPWDYPEFKMAV